MSDECGICGETLQRSGEEDLMRSLCIYCEIPYYICPPAELPSPIRTGQKRERPSVFALWFPFAIVAILELLYHFLT
ncbi:MAG: hypothetical protein JSW53_01835 [Candidatus Bathyarchaeota archaeon]|nr:MAG: hypothetical protein JSW53_01835 [Candidatus Bathyarchaeota archaeon]